MKKIVLNIYNFISICYQWIIFRYRCYKFNKKMKYDAMFRNEINQIHYARTGGDVFKKQSIEFLEHFVNFIYSDHMPENINSNLKDTIRFHASMYASLLNFTDNKELFQLVEIVKRDMKTHNTSETLLN